jgi:hypothetical protein
MTTKRQRIVESGILVASSFATKGVEELVVHLLGEPSRPFISPAGVLVNNTIRTSLLDIFSRMLSPREVHKIKTVVDASILEINSRLDGGATPRDDGFFTDDHDGRTKAEEIFKGVLLKAKEQHEEKKLEHFGYFYANVAFRSDVAPSLANFFIRVANALSYRQFVLLKHIADSGNIAFDAEMIRGREHSINDLIALTKEEMELHSPGDFGGYGLIRSITGYTEIVSDLGALFVDLFNLKLISNDDIRQLRQLILLCEDSPPRGSV